MEVSRSGYYAWKKRLKSRGRIENEKLLIEIKRLFIEHKETYGSPRMYDALNKVGITCSENRVAKLMRLGKLIAVQRRKFRITTNSNHKYPVAPNLLQRNFIVDKPNKVWVSDITYIWTFEGWLYLASVLDLCSRGVVGTAMDDRITDELTQQALKQALIRRRPSEGLMHHSDRGSQYASNDYRGLLKQHKMVCSMSRKGDCWDNAVAESFFHTLKVELVNRHQFKTKAEAKQVIFKYIEMYYNTKRTHSTLGYLSPVDYEKRLLVS